MSVRTIRSSPLTFRVLEYGATGSGVIDDTLAIQAAIDTAALAGGGEVLFDSLTYAISGRQVLGQPTGTGACLFARPNVRLNLNGATLKATSSLTGRTDVVAFGLDETGANVTVTNFSLVGGTIDGSAITTAGSPIRWVNASTTGSDASFERLVIKANSEWGISWGGMLNSTAFQRLTVRDVLVNGCRYGACWIGYTNHPVVENLRAINVSGNTATNEGCVLEVESGNYGRFSGISGENIPIQMVLMSGNLEASFDGISGSCASGAHGVEIMASNVSISGVTLSGGGGGGYGLYFPSQSSSVQNITIDDLVLAGFTNDIYQAAYTNSATIDGLTISDFVLRDAYGLVTNSSITDFAMSNGAMTASGGHGIAATSLSGTVVGVSMASVPSLNNCAGLHFTNCPGFNPVGPLTSPAVPASGTAVTNTFSVDATVYITGGTVTAVAVGGVTTGMTSGPVTVPAGQTISVTYSAPPFWTWIGN